VSTVARRLPPVLAAVLLLVPAVAAVGQGGVTVTGWGVERVFSAAALDSLSVDTAWVTPRGQAPEAHDGVALARLLGAAGVSDGDLAAGARTHWAFVEARDGYRVVLGFGELDPRVAGHAVVLERGTGDQAGTWRLVVPTEVRGPRWARDVVRIDIRGLARSADASRLVILARHAEKADAPRSDPPLTEAGRARADALAAAVAGAAIDAVIVTPFARTRDTGTPAAAARGVTPIEVSVGGSLAAHVAAVVEVVRGRPAGDAVLVVGHSNTIPAIVTALGGPALADLCDSQYAVLYVMTVPDAGPARLVTASYGTPDPPGGGCPTMR
jgi:phosphohistidine phosphatase SixA